MDFDKLSAEECRQVAIYAEQCERFDDMVKATTAMVKKLDQKMSEIDRNLLSVAFKNIVGSRRNAWRIFSTLKKDTRPELVQDYKKTIKKELMSQCNQVVDLLNDYVLDSDLYKGDSDSTVFFNKMKGDYFRYVSEILEEDDEERKDFVCKAEESYRTAYNTSMASLPANSPIRLGLALNYSVFHYEIANKPEDACTLAKAAFDEAMNDSDRDSDSHKDSALILQLLRDNLTLWTAAQEQEAEEDDNN